MGRNMPFSGRAEVVPSRRWRQAITGRTASIYGAKPTGPDWAIVASGWDIYWHGDGTVGRCKPPFQTEEEAVQYAANWNKEHGYVFGSDGKG